MVIYGSKSKLWGGVKVGSDMELPIVPMLHKMSIQVSSHPFPPPPLFLFVVLEICWPDTNVLNQ
jgi:hypothetical protein